MKIAKKIAIGLLTLFIGMQFYRPEKNTSEEEHTAVFLTETNPPAEVRKILEHSCYDCHSDHTNYPWYNNIAPVSYWMADHIRHGKGNLNFSEWPKYDNEKKQHKLQEVMEVMEEGSMPLKEYTWTHQEALLTTEQKAAVHSWAIKSKVLYQLGQRPE